MLVIIEAIRHLAIQMCFLYNYYTRLILMKIFKALLSLSNGSLFDHLLISFFDKFDHLLMGVSNFVFIKEG